LGYSNEINPFGDANLLTPFVWGKKKESERKEDKQKLEENNEEGNRLKLMSEIEKVRKRRLDREAELAEIERLRDEEVRLREMAQFGDWQRTEDEFHIHQTAQRSILRLLDYRGYPIDHVVKNFLMLDAAEKVLDFHQRSEHASKTQQDYELKELTPALKLLKLDYELQSPLDIIDEVQEHQVIERLQDLLNDLRHYHQWDATQSMTPTNNNTNNNTANNSNTHSQHVSQAVYWEAMMIVVQTILKRKQTSGESTSKLHQSIAQDVSDLLRGKNPQELNQLEHDIRLNLAPGKTVDLEYWELMLEEVILQRAKGTILHTHLQQVQQLIQKLSAVKETGLLDRRIEQSHHSSSQPSYYRDHHRDHRQQRYGNDRVYDRDDNQSSNQSIPQPTRTTAVTFATPDDLVVETYLQTIGHSVDNSGDAEETETHMMESDEVFLPQQLYSWQDKYRPRKPRYFNRVKTGWDRNKYNLTHYDSDNPPPVRIQGYKFTIFYPDLIDKSKTPRYHIEPCPDSPDQDFVIIRFHAGPPYEDIAFKIVNREWDHHRKSGFLSTFDRGILQLHFNFKKTFYRR
jgi:hypothetical protein